MAVTLKHSLRPSSRLCNEMLSYGENKLNHKNVIDLSITVKVPLFGHDHLSVDKKLKSKLLTVNKLRSAQQEFAEPEQSTC